MLSFANFIECAFDCVDERSPFEEDIAIPTEVGKWSVEDRVENFEWAVRNEDVVSLLGDLVEGTPLVGLDDLTDTLLFAPVELEAG